VELVDTERAYVKDLQFVIENYLQEMSRIDCPNQIKEKRDFIFSNIEDIFAFHKVLFYAQLAESDGDVDRLSRIFLKNRNNLELYVPYSVNRQFSESTLNSYEIIRKFFDVSSFGFLDKPICWSKYITSLLFLFGHIKLGY